jgi:hypothetical protein
MCSTFVALSNGYYPPVYCHHNGMSHVKVWTEICRVENNTRNNTAYAAGLFAYNTAPVIAVSHVSLFWQLHQQPFLQIIRYPSGLAKQKQNK